jgi:phosphotransacetylase
LAGGKGPHIPFQLINKFRLICARSDEIEKKARQIGVDLSAVQIVDHLAIDADRYARHLLAKRKHKGMTLERARDELHDLNVFGTVSFVNFYRQWRFGLEVVADVVS